VCGYASLLFLYKTPRKRNGKNAKDINVVVAALHTSLTVNPCEARTGMFAESGMYIYLAVAFSSRFVAIWIIAELDIALTRARDGVSPPRTGTRLLYLSFAVFTCITTQITFIIFTLTFLIFNGSFSRVLVNVKPN